MVKLQQYKTAFVMPSDDEIHEGIEIAKRDHCVVRINYFIPYSGSFFLDIDEHSTFEECVGRIKNGCAY